MMATTRCAWILRHLATATLLLLSLARGHGASVDRFVEFFKPPQTDNAALSPNGLRLAYTRREGDAVSIVTVTIDAPEKATSLVTVAQDKYALGYQQDDWGNNPSRVIWMRWVTDTRFVVESNMQFLSAREPLFGAVFGFDYDGSNARLLYSGRQAAAPVFIRGIIPGSHSELLVRQGRDCIALDAMTGATRTVTECETLERAIEAREKDEFSRNHAQAEVLRALFPQRKVSLIGSSVGSERTLSLVEAINDPGSFVVYEPATRKAWDFVRRAPLISERHPSKVSNFDLPNPKGEHFTGSLVLPELPRTKKIPLVIWSPDRLEDGFSQKYSPEVAALADMGFAVMVPNETLAMSYAGRDSFARLLECIDAIADNFPVSRKAVAVLAHGLTASQGISATCYAPGRIRCFVAIDPAFDYNSQNLEAALTESRTRPVEAALMLSFPGRAGLSYGKRPVYLYTRIANSLLKRKGVSTELSLLDEFYVAQQAEARAAQFRKIEEFLNQHLYRYSVQLGETRYEPAANH